MISMVWGSAPRPEAESAKGIYLADKNLCGAAEKKTGGAKSGLPKF
jgi:hypothetical protein